MGKEREREVGEGGTKLRMIEEEWEEAVRM